MLKVTKTWPCASWSIITKHCCIKALICCIGCMVMF
jgi:hypothetical protein